MNDKNPLDDLLDKVPSTTMHADREHHKTVEDVMKEPNRVWLIESSYHGKGWKLLPNVSTSMNQEQADAFARTAKTSCTEYRAVAYIREESTNAKS